MRLDKHWRQIDGDLDIAKHGGTIARLDGKAIEIRTIQPVREYVGDREAAEVGYPFWSKEAYYLFDDLDSAEALKVLEQSGIEPSNWTFEDGEISLISRRVITACACIDHGWRTDEGPSGWARDVFPPKGFYHCRPDGSRPVSGAFFADEDQEFRREILPQQRDARGRFLPKEQ